MSPIDLKRLLFQVTPPEPQEPTEPGLHHYVRECDGVATRFHLRVESDGQGMLLANATSAAGLSAAGVVIAQGLLDKTPKQVIAKNIEGKFTGVTADVINRDILAVEDLIDNLTLPDHDFPILNVTDAALVPHESELIAPFHADISLSDAATMLPLLDKIWQANIPHTSIILPTELTFETNDLLLAVERAEDLGMIAGIRVRASHLTNYQLLEDLAVAGIDHIDVLVASTQEAIHDAILGSGDFSAVLILFDQLRSLEIARVAQIPLVQSTVEQLGVTIRTLHENNIRNMNFFAIAAPDDMPATDRADALPANSLPQIADIVEESSMNYDVRFIWQPPVARNMHLTVPEQILRGPRTSDDLSVRITPQGDVIPSRGPNLPAGNLFRDNWPTIWNNPEFVRFRERVQRPTRCDECPDLAICAVDCPRKPHGWSNDSSGES